MKLNVRIVVLLVLLPGIQRNAARGQIIAGPEPLWAAVERSRPDTSRVNLFLKLSRFYGNIRNDLDSALIAAEKALRLSEELRLPEHINAALRLKVGILLWKNKTTEAMAGIDWLTAYARKRGDALAEAETYMYIARKISNKDTGNYPMKISFFEKARSVYRRLNQFDEEMEARNYITRAHVDQGKLDLAEKEYLEQLADARARGKREYKLIFLGLSEIAQAKADPGKQLYYHLEILKLCEAGTNTISNNQWKNHIYITLSKVYKKLERYSESENMSAKGMKLSMELQDSEMFYHHVRQLGSILFPQQKYREALAVFLKSARDFPPVNNLQHRTINLLIGNCYLELNQVDKAEPYFLAVDRYSRNMSSEIVDNVELELTRGGHYIDMARYYCVVGKYDRAREFLSKFDQIKKDWNFTNYRMVAMSLQIRIDTASGDFRSAFRHLSEFKVMNDSINSSASRQAMANLMVKYETEKKDQDLILRQQHIDLLTKQREIQEGRLLQAGLQIQIEKQERLRQQEINILNAEKREQDFKIVQYAAEQKDDRINLLSKQSQIQEARLEKAGILRNMTIAGLVSTLVIIGLLYNSYRLKKINNNQLTVQKNEIDLKNRSLQKLVEEKEWLLKELHHRVKNNLQIVMSLLNIQGYYLEDSSALHAIRDTQHRIHSISLIHKKLYLGENVGLISMPGYIFDLVNDLKESFATGQRIQFGVHIGNILLDASLAVPLGLILNEAVTNCIKYAFPSDMAGIITIKLEQTNPDKLTVTIADNGVGLPADFNDSDRSSLGMSMIRGLSGDLDGICRIESAGGTSVSVEFPYHTALLRKGEVDLMEKA
ncbi:histidine kinase dimerization/phosphoacceptor domain -containing protein [Chitinophaga sp. YIM B06452]|uniref:histidine kinase dimerization/phosphoacceptor domain -containing protein n=1 Tax=Chitinophaga sp. YIM B06452 TaxID=3082158 RepID=UPI0031FE89E6